MFQRNRQDLWKSWCMFTVSVKRITCPDLRECGLERSAIRCAIVATSNAVAGIGNTIQSGAKSIHRYRAVMEHYSNVLHSVSKNRCLQAAPHRIGSKGLGRTVAPSLRHHDDFLQLRQAEPTSSISS